LTNDTFPLQRDLLVFDLDGTLVDTVDDLTAAINQTLARYDLPPLTPAEVRRLVGDGTEVFIRRALGPEREQHLDEAVATYFTHYHNHLTVHTRPYDGVTETLEYFADKTKVVYTNKTTVASEQILRELGLSRHFAACYGAGDGFPCKPDPAALYAICERFGVPPDRTVMIGDGDTDILVAHNAGIAVLAASYGFRDRKELEALEPTAMFDTFDQLKRLIA